MNISQVRYVLGIVQYKTMREAAKKLFVSEPTISQQIKLFEQELGITLFDRNCHFMPTKACKALLPHFQTMIDSQSAVLECVCELKQPTLKSAQFIPTSGHLICPNCDSLIMASNGSAYHIPDTISPQWEILSSEKWQCMRCHERFVLPANPFKFEQKQIEREV